ncbi:MAG TPA: hypothetical protein VFM18_02270 [Methanosarcina sp.]|nr:hypothetical protein [Methanosarcina sp.]
MNNEVPFIYTSKGNLPIAELKYQTFWEVKDEYIKFVERHYTPEGELVRESCHVYDKIGIAGQGMITE